MFRIATAATMEWISSKTSTVSETVNYYLGRQVSSTEGEELKGLDEGAVSRHAMKFRKVSHYMEEKEQTPKGLKEAVQTELGQMVEAASLSEAPDLIVLGVLRPLQAALIREDYSEALNHIFNYSELLADLQPAVEQMIVSQLKSGEVFTSVVPWEKNSETGSITKERTPVETLIRHLEPALQPYFNKSDDEGAGYGAAETCAAMADRFLKSQKVEEFLHLYNMSSFLQTVADIPESIRSEAMAWELSLNTGKELLLDRCPSPDHARFPSMSVSDAVLKNLGAPFSRQELTTALGNIVSSRLPRIDQKAEACIKLVNKGMMSEALKIIQSDQQLSVSLGPQFGTMDFATAGECWEMENIIVKYRLLAAFQKSASDGQSDDFLKGLSRIGGCEELANALISQNFIDLPDISDLQNESVFMALDEYLREF